MAENGKVDLGNKIGEGEGFELFVNAEEDENVLFIRVPMTQTGETNKGKVRYAKSGVTGFYDQQSKETLGISMTIWKQN